MVDGMYSLMLGGMPATELGVHSPVEWETLADGGMGEASCTFALPADFHHPSLMRGTPAELRWGSLAVWSGAVQSYNKETGEFIGAGHSRRAYEDFLALDGSGNSTRDVEVAIAQAISRGWPVVNHGAATGVVAGDSTDPVTVGALLDQRAKELGQRWGVTARGEIYMRPDPTDFRYQTVPASAVLSPTEGDGPTHFVGVYFDGTNNLKTTRPALSTVDGRRREEPIDLTGEGTLTLAQANAILDGILATAPKVGWAQGMTLAGSQLRTIGDMPAPLPFVRAGDVVRVQGLLGNNGVIQAPYVDVVIGRTRYTAGSDEIQVDPVGLEAWNFRDALAAAS